MFCDRWVDEDLISYEDFVVLYELEKTDAKSMIAMIKGILRFGLDRKKKRGQCHDGCSPTIRK